MSLKKYKTFEDAREELWAMKIDEKYLMRVRRLFIMVERLSDRKVKRGIQKFRTIKESN